MLEKHLEIPGCCYFSFIINDITRSSVFFCQKNGIEGFMLEISNDENAIVCILRKEDIFADFMLCSNEKSQKNSNHLFVYLNSSTIICGTVDSDNRHNAKICKCDNILISSIDLVKFDDSFGSKVTINRFIVTKDIQRNLAMTNFIRICTRPPGINAPNFQSIECSSGFTFLSVSDMIKGNHYFKCLSKMDDSFFLDQSKRDCFVIHSISESSFLLLCLHDLDEVVFEQDYSIPTSVFELHWDVPSVVCVLNYSSKSTKSLNVESTFFFKKRTPKICM